MYLDRIWVPIGQHLQPSVDGLELATLIFRVLEQLEVSGSRQSLYVKGCSESPLSAIAPCPTCSRKSYSRLSCDLK